jgi:hypothetical protein
MFYWYGSSDPVGGLVSRHKIYCNEITGPVLYSCCRQCRLKTLVVSFSFTETIKYYRYECQTLQPKDTLAKTFRHKELDTSAHFMETIFSPRSFPAKSLGPIFFPTRHVGSPWRTYTCEQNEDVNSNVIDISTKIHESANTAIFSFHTYI